MSKDKKEKKVEEPKQSIPVTKLFRYADWKDYVLMFIATIAAMGQGAIQPLFALVFGDLLDAFGEGGDEEIFESIKNVARWFVIIGAGAFGVSFIQNSFWNITAERQTHTLRKQYLRAVLRQEIGWFDIIGSGEVSTRLSQDALLVQQGLEKFGTLTQYVSTFFGGFILGFAKGWKLTLVLLALTPLTMVSGYYVMVLLASFATKGQNAYAKAGQLAAEVISGIRTVTAFGQQKKEENAYFEHLTTAMAMGVKRAAVSGFGLGVMNVSFYVMFAVALGYGGKLVADGENTGGEILMVLWAVSMAGFSLGQAGPSLEAINKARGAGFTLFKTFDRVSQIDSQSTEGEKPEKFHGNITFDNVEFRYPTRPDAKVLRGVSFGIEAGKVTALVGPSGCGKSSIIQLIQRFYDPEVGSVSVDGRDARKLNVNWLRSNIGIVGQDPVLFSGTIADNISFGKVGATRLEIEAAAKSANAHNFIMQFPMNYDTPVGERGSQLSGGQKQRIAIARAIIKNPSVLLLDEATSALDNESEKIVQKALESVMQNRTTIIVAHRLSTIQHADKILVFKKGKVRQQGKHEELMKEKGLYKKLVKIQNKNTKKKTEDASEVAAVTTQAIAVEEVNLAPYVDEEDEEEIIKRHPVSFRRLFGLNRPESLFIVLGTIGAGLNGAILPSFSIVFSRVLSLYYQPPDQIESDSGMYAGIMIAIGAVCVIAHILQYWMFGISSERYVRRIRSMAFESIMKQDMGYFDSEKRSTGVLTSKLASEAILVGNLVGTNFSILLQNIICLLIGLIIAFTYGWKMTLVVLAASPFLVLGQAVQTVTLTALVEKTRRAYSGSNRVAAEAIANVRTLAAFTREEHLLASYAQLLMTPMRLGIRRAIMAGAANAVGSFSLFAVYALGFWYGGKLIVAGEYETYDVFQVFFAISFATMGISDGIAFAPDATKAKAAASVIFEIIDHPSKVDPTATTGDKNDIQGQIKFENVQFSYPERKNAKVLKGINFEVPSGKVIALVGQSGSGKSSIVSLLERFYIPSPGIQIDNKPIESYNVKRLREQISLVGQEPILFAGSIADNIRFGKSDATMEEVVAAAQAANAHTFIEGFPAKYDTQVGEKGGQLSGGQKQRIAIARAIIRKPKILLLDEATSALDMESEKIVQEALDRVMKGITTVIVAHRLSTIRDADIIAVVENGRVVEAGNHDELLAKNGAYVRLLRGRV